MTEQIIECEKADLASPITARHDRTNARTIRAYVYFAICTLDKSRCVITKRSQHVETLEKFPSLHDFPSLGDRESLPQRSVIS